MSSKRFEGLSFEEVVEGIQPKTVSIAVEIPRGLTGDDASGPAGIEHATRIIYAVELIRSILDKVEITNGTVYKTPAPEGHAQILPNYTFTDIKFAVSHSNAEFSFVYTLAEEFVVIKAPDHTGIKPYTKLK